MCLKDSISQLPDSWKNIFNEYKEDLSNIQDALVKDKEIYPDLEQFPEKNNIFNTFKNIDLLDVKVIILGQDCYHKKGQAIGVSFGVPQGIKKPPSLINIEKELKDDTGESLESSDLIYWNKQGVLLLNCALTVREACPGSHLKLWKNFVIKLINKICSINTDIIFILWGNFAKNVYKKINHNKNLVVEGVHPSPLSANRGGWFGGKYFSKTNKLLENLGKKKVKW